MKIFTQTVLALSAAICIVLSAGSAIASKQAVVKLTWKSANPVFLAPGGSLDVSGQGTVNETVIVATVNTTAGTPTPSVMWAAAIATGGSSGTFSFPPYTFFSSKTEMLFIGAATMMKSAPAAAASGGSTLPLPTPLTTKCFASVGPAMPGAPAFPGSCFPKPGTLKRSPGTKKYGGVARLLGQSNTLAFSRAGYPTGIDTGTFKQFHDQSPAFAVSSVGAYGVSASGMQYNTVLLTNRTSFVTHRNPPFTTGMVTAQGSNYGATIIYTGSNNFNPTNLTGMISLVRPQMGHSFRRSGATFVGNLFNFANVEIVDLTFAGEVPEPGSLAMLAFGTLGLVGLSMRRRR